MSEPEWPCNLPIWRRHHRAASPDGSLVAQIDPGYEVSMGNPTAGILCVSNGLHVERCNPSFVWSDDSRFLAVPQFFRKFVFRRQRLLVIDFERRVVHATKASAWYYQPELFVGGRLTATVNPSRRRKPPVEFCIPEDLPTLFFQHVWVRWPERGRPDVVVMPNRE